MTTGAAADEPSEHRKHDRVVTLLAKVFKLNPQGLNWGRAVMFIDVALVPLVLLLAIEKEQYLASAVFGVLFTGAVDPGGAFGSRTLRTSAFGLIGAAVTAFGFAIATSGWGWLVLAAFGVTLVAGLTVRFGLRRFAAANFLNVWFFIALALGASDHAAHLASHTWAQALAWLGGTALWIALTFVGWLLHGQKNLPPTVPELPGDTSVRKLTPPLIAFAVLRALGMAAATAVAFGLHLSHADWTPIAAIIAMKPSLGGTTVVAAQRTIGTVIGAGGAALLMLIPAGEHGVDLISTRHALEVVAIFLLMHGVAILFWNYALYTAAIAAGVLLAIDLPHPSNYSADADRVLWTLIGVAIAVVVLLVGTVLAKFASRGVKAQPAAA